VEDSYEFQRMLRTGSVCEVALVRSRATRKLFVQKSLKRETLDSSKSGVALANEGKLLADLDHPNIVSLVHYAATGKSAVLSMEYVDGKTVADMLAEQATVPVAAATHIALEVARGLSYLHNKGVVHTQLDPSNILCSQHAAVKLCDFSDAFVQTRDGARARKTVRSAMQRKYQSPEQTNALDADERSDVYSLGAILYAMLTGAPPGDSAIRAPSKLVEFDRGPSPKSINAAVPRALDDLVRKMLATDPATRPVPTGSIVDALSRVVESEGLGERAQALAPLFDGVARSLPRTSPRREVPRWPLFAAIGGGFLAIACIVQVVSGAGRGYNTLGETPLPLAPSEPGYLHVVVQPWAYVIVDGQQVETTPFLKTIPLAPGPHFVTLRHPSAKDDTRELSIVSGQTITINTTLNVEGLGNIGADSGAILIGQDAAASIERSHDPSVPRPKATR
jgi:tRNA A-37 threonylcarbamoyl transferase component Bud32